MRYLLTCSYRRSKKVTSTGNTKGGKSNEDPETDRVVLVILIMAVCITACGSKDSSDKCNCKEGACMKDGMCTEECKCPDMKDGMCPDDCMCMEDMDSDDMN